MSEALVPDQVDVDIKADLCAMQHRNWAMGPKGESERCTVEDGLLARRQVQFDERNSRGIEILELLCFSCWTARTWQVEQRKEACELEIAVMMH